MNKHVILDPKYPSTPIDQSAKGKYSVQATSEGFVFEKWQEVNITQLLRGGEQWFHSFKIRSTKISLLSPCIERF